MSDDKELVKRLDELAQGVWEESDEAVIRDARAAIERLTAKAVEARREGFAAGYAAAREQAAKVAEGEKLEGERFEGYPENTTADRIASAIRAMTPEKDPAT